MLDIKLFRNCREQLVQSLTKRGISAAVIDEIIDLDVARREVQKQADYLKSERNRLSKEVGMKKAKGLDASAEIAAVQKNSDLVNALDQEQGELEKTIKEKMEVLPNLILDTVPVGKDSSDNVEVRRHGTPRDFSFAPKAHWDLAEALDILDFQRATKIASARFVIYKGAGAALERALINFMLDQQTSRGYQEIIPPLMVNKDAAYGTGQLPKFEQDLFQTREGFYLIPTAEVPVTNIYRDEIIKGEDLPLKMTAYTPCFRSEAGAAGRDTRGIIRLHQFNKVELVKICRPDQGEAELELLTNDAERILQLLGLPYRVVALCTGDLGFGSAKTYDIEVWLPSYNDYKEISSCSLYLDFQARRMNCRYRDADGNVEYPYTINGSGLAIGRTFAAILENYQQADGSILIPEVLVKYLNCNQIKRG